MRLKDFKTINRIRIINHSIQILLGLCILVCVNYLAARYFLRKDLTSQHKYSLSAETIAYLNQLSMPVDIIVTIPNDASNTEVQGIFEDVSHLLREYEMYSVQQGVPKVRVEFVNIYQQRKRAEVLAQKYDITQENIILLVSGNKTRQILGSDLYELNQRSKQKFFKGEQLFTSAILDITNNKRQKIGFIVGHGEMEPADVNAAQGLSELARSLQHYNFDIEPLNLAQKSPVNLDSYTLLIIAAPKVPFLAYEVAQLKEYLDKRHGKIIALLAPMHTHGLGELLDDWGIRSDDAILVDVQKELELQGGDLIVTRFAPHAITKTLIDYQLGIVCGLSRPVRPDLGAALNDHIRVSSLIASSDKSWAKLKYAESNSLAFDAYTDLQGPISLAAVSTRNAGDSLSLNLPGGSIVVFGNGDFISNRRFEFLGNKILFLNAVNWCAQRLDSLNIIPKPLTSIQIPLAHIEFVRLAKCILGVPLIFIITGIGILYGRYRT